MLLGQIRIHAIEDPRIFFAQVARRDHAGEQHLGAAGLERGDDLLEIGLGASGVEAAQGIVGAQFQDHRVRRFGHCPAQPLQSGRRRIARNTSIDHFHGVPFGLQGALQLRGKGVRGFELIAGNETVAEHDDANRCGFCLGKCARRDNGDQPIAEENAKHHVCEGWARWQCPHWSFLSPRPHITMLK